MTVPLPFAPGVFIGAGEATRLIASQCVDCGTMTFPPQAACPADGAATTAVELAPYGLLYSHATIRTKPPFGLPTPYAVGYVDVVQGPRVFMLLDPTAVGDYRIGMALELTGGELGVNLAAEPCIRPFFRPRQ